jgi:hypothetical protein
LYGIIWAARLVRRFGVRMAFTASNVLLLFGWALSVAVEE